MKTHRALLLTAGSLLLLAGCGDRSTPPSGPDDTGNEDPGTNFAMRVSYTHQINDSEHDYAWHWIAISTQRWSVAQERWAYVMLPLTLFDGDTVVVDEGNLGDGLQCDPVLAPDDSVWSEVHFNPDVTFQSYTTGIELPDPVGWELDTLWVDSLAQLELRTLGNFDTLRLDNTTVDGEDLVYITEPGPFLYSVPWDSADTHELRLLAVQETGTHTTEVIGDTTYLDDCEYHIDMRVLVSKRISSE